MAICARTRPQETLAELGMAFWHDLAAPVIAGILASMIVNWLNKRK
ncbi:small toxic polypeptide ldrD (Modular protein) [Escherichia coli]|nr:small toxic polypeptide ldrD (Modular protein) [Escherichia coli]